MHIHRNEYNTHTINSANTNTEHKYKSIQDTHYHEKIIQIQISIPIETSKHNLAKPLKNHRCRWCPGKKHYPGHRSEKEHCSGLDKDHIQVSGRVAKCHRYGGYICVKNLEGWGKQCT